MFWPSTLFKNTRKAQSAGSHKNKILFFYRTHKKLIYFQKLKKHLSSNYICAIKTYHCLFPRILLNIFTFPIAPLWPTKAELHELLAATEQEVLPPNQKPHTLQSRITRQLLKLQIFLIYSKIIYELERHKPSFVLLWNGEKFQDKIFHCINKRYGIKTGFFENGLLPDSTTLDFIGINAKNSIPREPEFYKQQTPPSLAPPLSLAGVGKYHTRFGDYILVPFQKNRDSQILFNSPWIKTMDELFFEILKQHRKGTFGNTNIVFREHPKAKTCYQHLHTAANAHQNIFFDNTMLIGEAIANAKAVITINSTVGLESLLIGKKVIVLGDAFYTLPSLCLPAGDSSELTKAIAALATFTPNNALRSQFHCYLSYDYLVPDHWKRPTSDHFRGIKNKIDQQIQLLAEASEYTSRALQEPA